MQISFLNRLLNVSKKEWPRILLAWSLNLLMRTGFVMGWTATLAIFIHRLGAELLPFLLVLNALLIMLGTIIFSYLLQSINRLVLMVYTTLLAGALLFLATLFVYSSDALFFGIVLLAQSLFLSQMNILISLFTENLFSPLESQRTFPLIASSETFGGILGGLGVTFLISFLPAYKFIYFWIFALILIIPILLTSHVFHKKIPSLKWHKASSPSEHKDLVQKMKENFLLVKKVPFLKGVMLIVCFQFLLLNLFEFQYLKAIEQSVLEHEGLAFEVKDYRPETNLEVSLLDIRPLLREQSNDSIELQLTQNLALLQVLFSAGSFLVQMIFASRVISGLGIVSSLLIHPLVSLLSVAGMILNFNFFTAAVGRSAFEITSTIFHNAYHSSYYAIQENLRASMKELLEGFVKPFGAILGVISIFIVQHFYSGAREIFSIHALMLIVVVMMIIRLIRLQQHYTSLSHQNLHPSFDLPTRLNAIEILAQKGHRIPVTSLIDYLKNPQEIPLVKIKILETLGVHANEETLSDILECLRHPEEDVRRTALEILMNFKDLKQKVDRHPFTRYRLIQEIQSIFKIERSSEIRVLLIQLLAKLNPEEVIPFLFKIMKSKNEHIKGACIQVCGNFKDPNIIPYLKSYLKSRNPYILAQAVIALWPFEQLRPSILRTIEQLRNDSRKPSMLALIRVLGEVGMREDLSFLIQHLASTDGEVRYEAAKALCKLNHPASIPHIVEFLMHPDASHRIKKFIKRLDKSIVEGIQKLVHIRVSEYIHDILSRVEVEHFSDLDLETLQKLRHAYATVDEHEEVFKIDQLIHSQQPSYAVSP